MENFLYYINFVLYKLKERRTTWSLGIEEDQPFAAPKAEKEWQTQLEAMEKRVMGSIEKLD